MQQTTNIKLLLESYYPSLTNAEKKIADYILNNYENVMYLSLTELAELSGVGDTSVFRFCKQIGLKGYPELKLLLAQDNVTRKEAAKDISSGHYPDQIRQNIIEKINECHDFLDMAELEKAIALLKNAERIFFFGIGSSSISAQTAKERFLRIGIMTDVALEGHHQNMIASILTEKDVVVAFSLSGSTKDILEAVQIAKDNKVPVIALTSYLRSPLTKLADIVLKTAGQEHLMEGGTLTSSISQLYTVDLLVTGVALSNREKSKNMRERIGRSILDKMV